MKLASDRVPSVFRSLRAFDWVSLAISLAAIGLFSAYAYRAPSGACQLEVRAPGGRWIYPLEQDRKIVVAGALGPMVIAVEKGRVRVLDSSCPDKLCMSMGAVSVPGAWIACLPNRVFLRVLGIDEKIDATSF